MEDFKYDSEVTFNKNTSHGEIAKYIPNGSKVLEFGCATGYFSRYLTEELGCTVTGIEIDAEAIKKAEPYLKQAICCNIEHYDWPKKIKTKRFDVIVFADVLEHLKDPKAALEAALPFLNEEGVLLFSIPNIAHADVIAKLLYNRFDYTSTGILDDTHVHFFGASNLREFCDSVGLFLENLDGVFVQCGKTEQGMENLQRAYRDVLLSKEYAEIFQFVCSARKKSYAEERGIKYSCNISSSNFGGGLCYIDYGDGYSQNSAVRIFPKEGGVYDISLNLDGKAKKIRFDFVEERGYTVRELEAFADERRIRARSVKGVLETDGAMVLYDDDPWLEFECEGACSFAIHARLSSIYTDAQTVDMICEAFEKLSSKSELLAKTESTLADITAERDSLKNETYLLLTENERLNKSFENCKELYFKELESNKKNQVDYANLLAMYQSVANSTVWKMTKPVRVVLDLLKRFIKKVPPLYKIAKGVKCLKQNGIKYTLRKIRDKFSSHSKQRKLYGYTEEDLKRQRAECVSGDLKFSILVPLYNTKEEYLSEMIESVTAQTYSNWELCLADGSDGEHSYVEERVRAFAAEDSRIKYFKLKENKGISENTNECAKMAEGDYIVLLDHDDLLDASALYENFRAITETDADVLYSDEDHLSMEGVHVNPFYKPDFSPDLLRSQMYICHLLVIKRSLFDKIGGFDSAMDGSQDYDLMLRLSENTDKIVHIPRILYTWRECEGSTAANADAKPYAHTAGKNALDAHLKRVYGDTAYASDSDYTFVFDARYGTMSDEPLVSIIIPMKDKHELTDACVKSIIEKSTYENYEILILDNRSESRETFVWLDEIKSYDSRIRVLNADMEFNWSKINNFGIDNAKGDAFILLNNDTLVITPDWIERLCENALRDDIGVVGPLLLYEDGTIQHAGVVVGMGDWADHIFKGGNTVHFGAPYVSPMVSRNVLAVTGACMAFSRKTVDKIGLLDESFVICGSDIEYGIRAYQQGLYNKYTATVRLYHLESKSRDSYIPEQDFKRSYECYAPYRENVDPFFNINLEKNSLIPRERIAPMSMVNFKNFLRRCPVTAKICRKIKRIIMSEGDYNIAEIGPIGVRRDSTDDGKLRVNLLTPSVDVNHVFGGIATALKFFERVCESLDANARIITCDALVVESSSVADKKYVITDSSIDSSDKYQLVSFSDRHGKTIPIRENDVFVATAWWTAYAIKEVIEWQSREFNSALKPLVYMIQDYEPGFYAWSSRYLMADSTYRMNMPIYAVINSKLLEEHFRHNGYEFSKSFAFEPTLNDRLKSFLPESCDIVEKKKQILVYGRPSTDRNAFSLLVLGLKAWREKAGENCDWKILSVGESHDDVDLGGGVLLKSIGKLSIDEYAKTMLETYAGVSLMVSPHPSYPPLEMSTFGVRTITNNYSIKDMSSFNENISSLASCSPADIADKLFEITSQYSGKGKLCVGNAYVMGDNSFDDCVDGIASCLKEL